MTQARSQTARILQWGAQSPSPVRQGGLEAEPAALKNFVFFCKNNFFKKREKHFEEKLCNQQSQR